LKQYEEIFYFPKRLLNHQLFTSGSVKFVLAAFCHNLPNTVSACNT